MKDSAGKHRTMVGACATGTAIFLFAAGALAKDKERDNRAACNASYQDYKTARENEKAGHLRDARELYVSCSNAPCAGVAQRCAAQLTALNAALPSVVPIVTDDAGEPRIDVQVKVDGQVLVSKLDGWSHPVEPGLHEFSFSTDAGVFATQKVMLIEGERNRQIAVTMHSSGKPPANRPAENKLAEMQKTASAAPSTSAPVADTKVKPEEPAPESTAAENAAPETAHEDAPKRHRSLFLPVVAGTVGLAGLAAGGLLTYWGRQDNTLLSQCSNTVNPTRSCLPSSVDHIRTLYIAADISFGVAAVGLVAATWLYLRSGSGDQKAPPQTAYTFDVHPTPSGAFASVKKAF